MTNVVMSSLIESVIASIVSTNGALTLMLSVSLFSLDIIHV